MVLIIKFQFFSWLWILLTVVCCALFASLLSFLFAPREVSVKNDILNLQALNISNILDLNNQTIGLIISFKDTFFIQNNNYFAIKLNKIQFEINRNLRSIEPKIRFDKNMVIQARRRELVDIFVDYEMFSDEDPYTNFCLDGLIKNLFSLVKTTFTFSTIWSANLQTSISVMQYIGCHASKQ